MISTDRDAWLCDLAETYHILDVTGLSVQTLATLSFGLRDDARIKILLSDTKVQSDRLLMAMIVDRLSLLCWSNTKDAQKGINRPVMLADKLIGYTAEDETTAFTSVDDFKSEWSRISGGSKNE